MIRDSLQPSEDQVRTVLIVEDEILVRLVVAEELREAGMRVIEAANAEEAMQHLRAGIPVDFAFTDIELPGPMNGLELACELEANFPEVKLLMTSGRMPAHETLTVKPFIIKPYDIADVVARIRAELADRRNEGFRINSIRSAADASDGRVGRPCSPADRRASRSGSLPVRVCFP